MEWKLPVIFRGRLSEVAMFKHVSIKLTILLVLLLLFAMSAPLAFAQTTSGKAAPKNTPQVTIPAQPVTPTYGEISNYFKIRPTLKKSNVVDFGSVIMYPQDPYKVYYSLQFDLLWWQKNHPALAVEFRAKDPSKDK